MSPAVEIVRLRDAGRAVGAQTMVPELVAPGLGHPPGQEGGSGDGRGGDGEESRTEGGSSLQVVCSYPKKQGKLGHCSTNSSNYRPEQLSGVLSN